MTRLDRGRKLFLAAFCLVAALLTWDRLLLGDAPSGALDPSDAVLAFDIDDDAGGVWLSDSAARQLGGAEAMNHLLEEARQQRRAGVDRRSGGARPAIDQRADLQAFSRRNLASVMAGGRGGASVMIDGQILYLGQQIDGFRLTAVDHQGAWFQTDDARIRLSTVGPPRAEWLDRVVDISTED